MRRVRYIYDEFMLEPPVTTEEFYSVAEAVNNGDEIRDGEYDLERRSYAYSFGEEIKFWGDAPENPTSAGRFFSLEPGNDELDDLDAMIEALGRVAADFRTAPDGTDRVFNGFFQCEMGEESGGLVRLYIVDGDVVEVEPEIVWPDPASVKRARMEQADVQP
jgi:hypothetical protein